MKWYDGEKGTASVASELCGGSLTPKEAVTESNDLQQPLELFWNR